MKWHFSLLSAVVCVAPCVVSAVPENVAGYTIQVELGQAQACDTEMYQEAKGPWFDMPMTPLRLEFPANVSNDYTTPHPHNNAQNKWPDIQVSYAANAAANQAYVKVGNGDFDSLCILTFTDALSGTAEVFLHEDGQTRHFRHVTFTMQKGLDSGVPLLMPQPNEPEIWDDGLNDILAALEKRTCKSATDKLYRKRLLMLLPLIQETHNPNTTTPETKGNTAMHYACGLSHVELVQWLIDHGADLNARTDKGATIDACIGGKNAAVIKKLIEEARLNNADHRQLENKELSEEQLNKLDAAIEAKSLFVDAFIQLPKLGDHVERVVITFSQNTAKAPVVDIVRRAGGSSFTPYTAVMHVCGRVSLKDGAQATLLVAPEYHHLSISEPEARFSMDIARHFGKHFRAVSYFVGDKTLSLYYTPEGDINEQRTTDAVPQDVYCVPVEFKVKGPAGVGK